MAGRLPLCFALLAAPCGAGAPSARPPYPWLATYNPAQSIRRRIPPPAGCQRTKAEPNSFAAWLRGLPLKPGRPPVLLYNGQRKRNQAAHHAVLDIDVGNRDLQQCADAVMRLRAEYLYSRGDLAAIHFDFTSGDRADFTRWAQGFRPIVRGSKVAWAKSARPNSSHDSLRSYLTRVYIYAGTLSLSREMRRADAAQMQIGDVFIQGGSPGHAVLVIDMAVEPRTGRKLFLLAQSYMPAQDVHVLRNPADAALSPWYPLPLGATLRTPEWNFRATDLKRF